MDSKLSHIYLYVSDLTKSKKFYEVFLGILGYEKSADEDWGCCFSKDGMSIWLEQTPKDHIDVGYNRRRTGLNHLAFLVSTKEQVDHFNEEFLKKNNIKSLYDTPKAYPEYGEKYYAVFFEDPDRIKLEVVFH